MIKTILKIMYPSLKATQAASPYRLHEEANVPPPLGRMCSATGHIRPS